MQITMLTASFQPLVFALLVSLGCAQVAVLRGAQVSAVPSLVETLRSDPDARARIGAATLLARSGSAESVEPLRRALASEKEPRVVDAIVEALERLGAPVVAPERCRDLVGRCWEAAVARPLFERWRASATQQELLDAAATGPAVLRALALHSLTEPASASRTKTAEGPPGSLERLELDATTRERLLDSVLEVFSTEKELGVTTRQMLLDSLWEMSGRSMPVVLERADRSSLAEARYRISYDLALREPDAYLAYRRPRQLLAAVLIAVPLALLLMVRRLRHPAGLLLASILAWGLWSLISQEPRQLPPYPFPFLTASFLSFLSAGVVSVLIGLLRWQRITSGTIRGFGRVGIAGAGAGGLAAVLCLWSRTAGLVPVLNEGWDLIVEPFGCLILGILAGGLLTFIDTVITQRRARRETFPA